MPPSLYAVAGLIVALLLSNAGWYAVHAHDQSRYKSLQLEIETAHTQAIETANAHILRQESLNDQLEKSRNQNLDTANAYHDQLLKKRLPRPGNCQNSSTGQPENQAGHDQLSEDFDRLVKREFYRADKLAGFVDECYNYINKE